VKGKQKEVIPPTDDEEVSEHGLEYNEVDESDESGSEFKASDDEDSDVAIVSTARKLANKARAASPDMDEAEGEMVEAAIEESLRSTRSAVRNGASPSKFHSLSDADDLSVSDFSEESGSEDEQPLSKKGKTTKGKGKGKAKAGSAAASSSSQGPKVMDLKELRKQKRLERQAKTAGRKALKQEERALAKELGRALIQV
jgi:DNA repair protein RAD16